MATARKHPNAHEENFRIIFYRAMDLHGQGELLGYPLITEIGESLMGYTEMCDHADPRDIEIIAAHVNAMRTVLTKQISGEGKDVDREIIAGLRKLTLKR